MTDYKYLYEFEKAQYLRLMEENSRLKLEIKQLIETAQNSLDLYKFAIDQAKFFKELYEFEVASRKKISDDFNDMMINQERLI